MAKKSTESKEPGKRGRPSTFDPKIAAEICERLSKGEPLAVICRDAHMPPVRTVSSWKEGRDEFSADFARAREEGYDAIATECLAIADDTSQDTIQTEHGERPNTEWIQRSKLRIETRLKLLAKWDVKRYGDKLALGGSSDMPPLAGLSDEDLAARIAALQGNAKAE